MENKPLVPKLRFPEFRDQWAIKTVGEFLVPDSKHNKAAVFECDKILTVKLHGLGVVRNERTGTLTGATNYQKRRAGQFIFSKIDLLNGAFGVVPEQLDGFYSSTDVPAFSFAPGQSPEFFVNWLKENYRRLAIERTGTSATLKRVSPDSFLSVPIPAPAEAEQRKIAECLTSLDELIAAEGRRLEALRDHKKGLLQNLFPRPERTENGKQLPAETTPRLRFPEFRTAGEWKPTTVGEIATLCKGKGISKTDLDPDGVRLCIRYGELYTRYGEIIDTVYSRTSIADTDLFLSRANDVIVPSSGETKWDIATASCVINDGIALGGDLNVLRTRQSGVFLSYYVNGTLRPAIARVAQGDTVVHLYPSQLAAIALAIPALAEQHRIASCLASLDDLITAQSQKLDTLKTHKQGLMQGLFPSTIPARYSKTDKDA